MLQKCFSPRLIFAATSFLGKCSRQRVKQLSGSETLQIYRTSLRKQEILPRYYSTSNMNPSSGENLDDPLAPPKILSNMKELDRGAFSKVVKVPFMEIHVDKLDLVTGMLRPYLLKLPNFKPICQSEDDSSKKLILLNPRLIQSMDNVQSNLKTVEKEVLKKVGIFDIHWKEITLNYDNWNHEDILKALLPENVYFSGYSIIGHILHVNLKEHHQEYKNVIAAVLLDKLKQIKTVVNKSDIIDNVYRNFKMEILAGDSNMVAKVKEGGCQFELDFSKVYWNPRLSTEHERIVLKLKKNDVVFDVFAGVGPFSIPAAKKGCKVFANDLNPHSYEWLCSNSKLNKVEKSLFAFNKDGKDFILNDVKENINDIFQSENKGSIHIIMNLPALAVEFLKYFKSLIKVEKILPDELMPIVHVYMFIKSLELDLKLAEELVEKEMGHSLAMVVHKEVSFVRLVAPNKRMIRVTFQIPSSVLLDVTACTVTHEPPSKKACLSD